MAACMLGYTNRVLSGSIAAGSEISGLSSGNLQTQQGGDASAWRTAGAVTSAAGAYFTLDAGAAVTWRAFALAGTNLTSAASVRWRVGPAEAIIEAAPAATWRASDAGFSTGWTWTRSGGARASSYFDLSGSLAFAAAATPRYGYDPATLAFLGLLLEPARTNAIINPAAEGAVAGTPGTAPNNSWAIAPQAGISSQIVGTGTESGIPYIDVRLFGTASGTSFSRIYPAGNATPYIVATSGQTWALSAFATIVAGSLGATSGALYFEEYNGTTYLAAAGTAAISIGAGGLATQRYSVIGTTANVSTTRLRPMLHFGIAAGAVVDFTVRIGAPQCELGACVTMPILPVIGTPAATARGTDSAIATLPAGFGGTPGATLYAETITTEIGALAVAADAGILRLDDGSSVSILYVKGVAFSAPWLNTRAVVATSTTVHNGSNVPLVKGVVARQVVGGVSGSWYSATNGGSATSSATAGTMPALTRAQIAGGADRQYYLRDLRAYGSRLTNGQILALSGSGSTVDATAAVYDSGAVAGGVAPGFRQSILVAPATVSGQYARCDIEDAANPDGFISVALAYAGPVWQPSISYSQESGLAVTRGNDSVRTRSGATIVSARYYERGWTISHDAVKTADLWASLVPMDKVAADGTNILFVPDPAGANIAREAVFGILDTVSDIGYRTLAGDVRTWRGRIAERL